MQQNGTLFADWHKTKKSLSQELRHTPLVARIDRAVDVLPSLLKCCGEGSWNRRMALKIARALCSEHPTIYAPCCPDYGHNGETYTFQGLGYGVSLLAERHITFLESFAHLIPEAHIVLLLADQEVNDREILRAVGVDIAQFNERMAASLIATRERIAHTGWEAQLMTTAMPDLLDNEIFFARAIEADESKQARLTTEAISRSSMYVRINGRMSSEEMLRRTIRTAAQYLAMGHFVAGQNALVCNHTTTNLSWYGETNAAVLHNPISVY